MLKTWGLTNFKSIHNTDLDLAPLTVLTGTNSSGKSSFIQSILLIAQTMQNKYKEYALILNGQYVNFGKFDDIMSFHQDDNNQRKSVPVGIRWTCKYNEKRAKKEKTLYDDSELEELYKINDLDDEYSAETEIQFNLEYDTYSNENHSEINRQIMPCLKSVKLVVNTIFEDYDFFEDDYYEYMMLLRKGIKKIHIEKCEPNSLNEYGQKKYYNVKRYSNFYGNDEDDIIAGAYVINADFFHFLPMNILFSGRGSEGKIFSRWGDPIEDLTSETLLKGLNENFLSKFMYIGPLREDPKPFYPLSEFSYMSNFGKKGENTAAILALNSKNINTYPIPNWGNSGEYKSEEKSLKESVIEWLNYIGVAEDVQVSIDTGGFTLKVKTPNSNHFSDLNNVGVGVSQVVPIVVSCLFANKGSTLIFEQPELHLHPKMQTKLTNFFVAISQSGRQCIIETHSEHIINALRYRIATTPSPNDEKLTKDIQIYFSTKDDTEGTIFKSIKIDKYSAMSEWPEDFFDEAQLMREEIIESVGKKLEKDFPDE